MWRARTRTAKAPAQPGYTILRHDRNWKVMDPEGELVCIALYKKGAKEYRISQFGVHSQEGQFHAEVAEKT